MDMSKVTRRLTVCCLLLLSFAGHLMAQEDAPFVIKKDGHYLSHVLVNGTWVLKDVTTFHPDSCLWYSGTQFNSAGLNHNYYFVDGNNYHFLSAPLEPSASLSYSSSMPYTYLLRNRDGIYYFYDWDWDNYPVDGAGLARAYQYTNVNTQEGCTECGGSWEQTGSNPVTYECWRVYWVEYRDNAWQMSDHSSYSITPNSARFRAVTVTETISALNNSGLRELKADNVVIPSSGIVMEYSSGDLDRALSATITTPYEYTVHSIYTFEGVDHPIDRNGNTNLVESPYRWTISGEGESYLSFESGSTSLTSTSATPTLYYRTENVSGDKTATLTLTVSYQDGSTQTLSTTILLKTDCQNPQLAGQPIVNHSGVRVSWYNTNADAYRLWWRKKNSGEWASIDKGTDTSHFFPVNLLEYEATYEFWISASCGGNYKPLSGDPFEFTAMPEAGLVVHGAIYGGGRMANVTGNTEVVVINCDSIGGVYGGNDIAGEVEGDNGSTIQLGVNSDDATYASMGVTEGTITISSVYGGGNGYYTYDDHVPGPEIGTDYHTDRTFSTSVTEVGGNDSYMTSGVIPTIQKTAIMVKNDYVKVDSIFGGAKNAFLTQNGTENNGSSITIDGGTIFAVFGGNNVGGTVGTAKHHILVNQTTTLLENNIVSTATTGYGRDFGIRYLFGGGNKVTGSTTDILIEGGQMDTIFGGGNMASVTAAYMEVDCEPAAGSGNYTFGKVYSNAITAYSATDGYTIDEENYPWDGNGIYNVHTLFGGNNKAAMNGIPHITLTSGSIGTAYGGGNAGDMLAVTDDPAEIPSFINHTESKTYNVYYGTRIEMASSKMVVDYLYGGCQVSNVDYSTYVFIRDGHVGSVYGGCNVSGDVGSLRTNLSATSPSEGYQAVKGGTYVRAVGGIVYKDFFAGSNGFYHCNDGTMYKLGIDYGDPEHRYIGMLVPTHNETHLFISKDNEHPNGVTIKGDAYTGGNLACVGYTNFTVPRDPLTGNRLDYPQFVGLASLHMDGGRVEGSVYGGGKMASVYGSNEVKVDGGYIGGALYGGNDRTGQVAQITNRVWPSDENYDVASDDYTSLDHVYTYVGITGEPEINTVYGGGNGAYDYENGDMEYCLLNDQPIQSNTFVDINLEDGGHINTVFGGGNGVTVTGAITVFFNVNNPNYASQANHVETIFGGNNLGSLDILSDIILLKGKVGTVYGGCNEGAMVGPVEGAPGTVEGANGTTYSNVGSFVRLRNEYPTNTTPMTPTAVVTGAVYGGCRMNGVTNNSIVLVEGGNHPDADIYGGSDISGDVAGTSQVVVIDGTHNNGPVVDNVFGGGNGEYDYSAGSAYENLTPPYSVNSRVDMLGGTAANLFAGGNNGECGLTIMNVNGGTVTNRVFGGGNLAGVVKTHDLTITSVDEYGNPTITTSTSNTDGTSTVTVTGGTMTGGIFGGNNLAGSIEGPVNVYIYDGNFGTSASAMMADGIFGGGYGEDSETDDDVTVTIGGTVGQQSYIPTIYGAVYGGSALGQVNTNTDNLTLIDFQNGNLYGDLYGGGMGRLADNSNPENPIPAVSAVVNGDVQVAISNGNLYSDIYGGCHINGIVNGDIEVGVTGGTVGTNNATADIFGGGYGHLTTTEGDVLVNINGASVTVNGDVYGGSGYGDVNSPAANGQDSDDTTTVNIFDGTINGDIYGGGLGQNQIGNDPTTDYPAHVNGKVYVNVGTGEMDDHDCPVAISGNATINGSVYGCNNVNGTPLDSVYVNIYRTAHGATIATNHYPTEELSEIEAGHWTLDNLAANAQTQAYAIKAVYGGGNKAAYLPPLANGQPRCATVHVWDCQENTIEDVYGGGNAADVGTTGANGIPANTRVIIDGGRIHRMFGGGNGYSASHNHNDPSASNYNPGANIYGTASSYVYAGLIDEVYGGANQWGSIDNINLNVLSTTCCSDAVYRKVFGCANEAPINHDIVTTIGCGVGEIGELYGGSNLASIGVDDPSHKANVTLNLYGGNYQKVFGGSKGSLGSSPVAANIYGDVTLNLYGGTVIDAFGGSDQNGNIKGIVTVNVLDDEDCHLDLTNVYGGSNRADYDPWLVDGEKVASPIVNVMHIHNVDIVEGQEVTRGIRGNVYGGGYQASINANPVVNIGYDPDVVVYGTTTMADLIPANYPSPNQMNQLHNFPYAFISGKAFGGGDLADVTGHTTVNMRQVQSQVDTIFGGGNQAGVYDSEINVYNGKVVNGVYGGCNVTGTVGGDIVVNMLGGTLGTTTDNIVVFGGGLGQPTETTGNVTVNIGDNGYAPNIYGTVYGGSALGSVNSDTEDITKVWLKSGTVNGRVFGGGLGQKNGVNGATSNVEAHVNGNIQVIGDGTNVTRAIFGANDQNGDPEGTVTVTINNGTIGNVMGGGSVAKYTAPLTDRDYPYVTINGGTVTNKVVGGGNEADVDGNTRILVTGGTIGTDGDATTGVGKGIYGGCNTTGDVTGNTTITLTGGTIGVNTSNTANIHGGGYGDETNVKGNVTIYFGDDTDSEKVYPLLYGELYGGSALGDVNTNDINAATASTSTIVNLRNGTINGGAYGGGLGDATNHIAAIVWGEVHVNVGAAEDIYDQSSFTGKANLVNCDVYGGNNLYGTPKQNVYVDVYQTAHDATNTVDYYVSNNWEQGNPTFAIHNVFGGGNRADYNPVSVDMRANVYAHMCENTVERLFGGSNAAAAPGVDLTIDGGHFNEVYGGGNGELIAANIGVGGIHILLGGGYIHQLVNGSNDNGTVQGPIVSETMTDPVCSEAVVEDYYLGTNHTDLFEDINATIYCGGDGNTGEMKFVNLYCGSNKAQIWGNINVTIEGGVFDNVFGGSKGDKADLGEGHENFASNIRIISDSLVQAGHAELAGRVGDGGNVNLTIIGGSIGNLYGGCDVYGNIENKINLEVYSADFIECPLFIGNIYGGANRSNYKPIETDIVDGTIYSPKVKVIKGNIGGESSRLPVKPGNPGEFEGNVFGGGEHGYVTSNPKVIVGNGPINTLPVNIEGNVFGGGSYGDVTGNPVVVVVPDTHSLTITQPENTTIGIIKATNGIGNTVSSGSTIGEDLDVNIKAIASVYGKKFDRWIVGGEGARVGRTNSATTLFTMGTADATLEASFVTATTHNFTYTFEPASSGCTVKVYDGMGQDVNSNVNISEGAELNIVALPNANGYRFDHWEITSGNGTIANLRMANTTFTMGTTATSIKAVFMTATTHTLNITQPTSGGTFTVKDNQGNTVSDGASISVGAVLDLVATPANRAYRFSEWVVTGAGARVGNANSAVTTFTMGTSNATITAVFTLPSEPEPEPEPDPQH